MKRITFFIIFLSAIAGCSSHVVENGSGRKGSQTQTNSTSAIDDSLSSAAHSPKLSFYFSASGTEKRPADSFIMDTSQHLGVTSTFKLQNGKFHEVHGMAIFEPKDYDTLSLLVFKFHLLEIDPADLRSNCSTGEMYKLSLAPLVGHAPLVAQFSECALEYNLLLEPQRTGLKTFMEWMLRMREKYRPYEAEDRNALQH